MKSRIIALALFTLLATAAPPAPMRTGAAGPPAGAPTENHTTSTPPGRAPAEGAFCGTPPAVEAGGRKLAAAPRAITPGVAAPVRQGGVVTIPVYFHVIRQGTSVANGNVPEYVLDNQIFILNRAFSGQAGGVNTSFRFERVGVTRTTNSTWYQMDINSTAETQAKTALHVNAPYVLNFYTIGNNDPVQPYAWATFPSSYEFNSVNDGVVVPFMLMPGLPNASPGPFNAGDIAVHEVGHWLGLFHTFEGGCNDRDQVLDTPAHAVQTLNDGITGMCPTATPPDTCLGGGLDPIHNYMQSTSDACKNEFTQGQSTRMNSEYAEHRQPSAFPTVNVTSVQPSELTGGPPHTLRVLGNAQNGYGDVQVRWRDTTVNGPENIVTPQSTPDPNNHTWTSIINPGNKCHNYSIHVYYAGVRSQTFPYNGANYCNETTRVIWIQPYSTPGVGSPGSLIVAGSAENAPPGYGVQMWYRDVTAGTGWVLRPYAPPPDSNGIWLNEIPNANFSHVYQVQVTYDVVTSAVCSYAGQNSISWCQ
jgi:hypothetical protein